MKYKVIGADKETGNDVELEVIAISTNDAQALASNRGILVSSIVAVKETAHADMDVPIELEPETVAVATAAPAGDGNHAAEAHGEAPGAHGETHHGTEHASEHSTEHLEYKLVVNQSMMLLERVVNRYILEGWIPQGGLTIAIQNNAPNFYQAMIRHPKKVEEKVEA